jgi:hypothetical protein
VANVALEAFVVKQEVPDKKDTPLSYLHFLSSTFIDLNDSSNEDVSLPVSFDVNVSDSFQIWHVFHNLHI